MGILGLVGDGFGAECPSILGGIHSQVLRALYEENRSGDGVRAQLRILMEVTMT